MAACLISHIDLVIIVQYFFEFYSRLEFLLVFIKQIVRVNDRILSGVPARHENDAVAVLARPTVAL
jgi:hypothetical protein